MMIAQSGRKVKNGGSEKDKISVGINKQKQNVFHVYFNKKLEGTGRGVDKNSKEYYDRHTKQSSGLFRNISVT